MKRSEHLGIGTDRRQVDTCQLAEGHVLVRVKGQAVTIGSKTRTGTEGAGIMCEVWTKIDDARQIENGRPARILCAHGHDSLTELQAVHRGEGATVGGNRSGSRSNGD
jgi:hypothetical protein